MNKGIARIFLVATALLGGCALQQTSAYRAKAEANQTWLQQQTELINAGKAKRSDVLVEYFSRLSQPPVSPQDVILMDETNKMIPLARAAENGSISKEEYQDKLREITTNAQQKFMQLQQQEAQAEQRRKSMALQYFLMTKPVTTNCSGVGAYTSCTTY